MEVVKMLAVYAILHITYTDMGLEVGDKYKKLVQKPWFIYPILLATVLFEFDYAVQPTAVVTLLFYSMMLWGNDQITLPFLDKLAN